MNTRTREVSEKLKALSHPHRLDIVHELLSNSPNVSSLQQQLGIPQPSVSAHLAKLRQAGIIQGERHGQEINYSLVDDDARQMVSSLFS